MLIHVTLGGFTVTQLKTKQRQPLRLLVRLCSDKAAFEALVQRRVVFSMDDAKRRLERAANYKMVVYTPHLLVLKCDSAEITLSKDGRMVIKRVKDEKEAKSVACRVWRTILRALC